MHNYNTKRNLHCRWCGQGYSAKKPRDRDGFCSRAHRQAHYRAYKNYVTHSTMQNGYPGDARVTRKKHETHLSKHVRNRKS